MIAILEKLGFVFDTLTPEEAARALMEREVRFRYAPVIVELVEAP